MILCDCIPVTRLIFRSFPVLEQVTVPYWCFVDFDLCSGRISLDDIVRVSLIRAAVQNICDRIHLRFRTRFGSRLIVWFRWSFRCMRIGNGKAIFFIVRDRRGISPLSVSPCDDRCFHFFQCIRDRFSVLIDEQICERSRPVVVFVKLHFAWLSCCICGVLTICKQFYRDRVRADAVRIFYPVQRILPDFCNGHLCLFRYMRVDNMEPFFRISGDSDRVSVYLIFCHLPFDSSALQISRHLHENGPRRVSVLPVFAGEESHAILVSISQHSHPDVILVADVSPGQFGPDAVPVIIIDPGNIHRNLDEFRRMDIGDRISGNGIAGYRHVVCAVTVFPGDHIGHLFFYGVFDLPAIIIFIQICEGTGPVIFLAQHQRISYDNTVRKQAHGNKFRPKSFPVSHIIPDLMYAHLSIFRNMLVGYDETFPGIAADLIGIPIHDIFADRIIDLPAVFVHIQICKAGFPAFGRRDFFRIRHKSVSSQTNCDAVRTLPVLISVVIPDLCHFHRCLFRYVCVDNTEPVFRIAVDIDRVTVYLILGQTPTDFCSVLVFRKLNKDPVLPAVCCRAVGHAILLTIREQTKRRPVRTDTVTVIVIFPFDLHRDFEEGRCMRVCDGIACCGIAGNRRGICAVTVFSGNHIGLDFLHGIFDQFSALFIFVEEFKSAGPAVFLAQHQRFMIFYENTIRQQAHSNGIWPEPFTITHVIPYFMHTYLRGFRCIRICDGKSLIHIAADLMGIPIHDIFAYRIGDLPAVFIHIQIVECRFPFIVRCDFFRIRHKSVGSQTDSNTFRTLPVLISVVIPDLCHFHRCLFRYVCVDDMEPVFRIAGDVGRVTVYLILGQVPLDFCTVLVFGKLNKDPVLPAVSCRAVGHAIPAAIREQKKRRPVRPDTIPVVFIFPGNIHRNFDSFRGMGVCDSIAGCGIAGQ